MHHSNDPLPSRRPAACAYEYPHLVRTVRNSRFPVDAECADKPDIVRKTRIIMTGGAGS